MSRPDFPAGRVDGLQPERTSLAWQRTALAFLVLGVVGLRLAWPVAGAWSLLPSAIVVAGATAVLFATRPRHLSTHGVAGTPPADGRLPLLAAALAVTLGLLAAGLLAAGLLATP